MKAVAKWIDEVNTDQFSIFFTNYPDVVFVLEDKDGNELALATADNLSDPDEAETTDFIEIHNFGVVREGYGYGKTLIEFLKKRYTLEAHNVLSAARWFWERMDVTIIE